ncbi:hypothetical protein Tsubulata_025326 [Turnera subulata]|uniref:Cytochrome P450 n=1 Tax=Turnera subulata TaxID=218843 RepID=A0A9Q0J4Z6_9ROSI|nr:hypothetical protein Tsubulata_025326 [Turnera subulata]
MMMEFQIDYMINVVLTMTFGLMVMIGVLRLYGEVVVRPKRVRGMLMKQGISGPKPALLLGNIPHIRKIIQSSGATAITRPGPQQMMIPSSTHNCAASLFPFFHQWRKQFGEVFVFSLGSIQIVFVNEADMVREISTCTSLDLGKPSYQHKERGPLLGHGILTSNGAVWAHHRKILAPEFYMDKVKGMTKLISESTITLLNSWKSIIDANGGIAAEIKIDQAMRSFSGDVISRACFGSSYSRGAEIFLKLRALQEAMSKRTLSTGVPGLRYLPTKTNREAWSLEKEVRKLILQVVRERSHTDSSSCEKDLLQMILESAKSSNFPKQAMDRFIVDNCKNIYLAGYETTAVAATWCLMLLAANPEWQDRVRAEVIQVCGGHYHPTPDMLRKMKQLTMVIHETLRLYPPVAVVSREALKDMKFGGITIPKGVNIWTVALTLHTDPEIWGPDAYSFNPGRFGNGIAGACKLPHVYMPFGVGPRVCLGQNLAMAELKILISLVLSNFSLSLSPTYIHSPALRLVIEPEYGVDLLVRKL